MKQPELGRKIFELRKAKRLTQEELVEKCNISIRTIQRIEAGEVTPRDYTIKTILAALNYDLDQISNDIDESKKGSSNRLRKFFLIEGDQSDDYYIKHMNVAWVFGICYTILRFIEGVAEYSRFFEELIFSDFTYSIIKVGIVVTFVLFQRGFIIIGTLIEDHLLKMISSVFIGISILVFGFDLVSILSDSIDLELVIFVYAISYGVVGMIYGYSLTRLPTSLGEMPKIAGFLEIIAALFSLSVILSFIGPFILIPAELLEIMIIYKAVEMIRMKEKTNSSHSLGSNVIS
ncbi:helix-turn-helix domain-containing protein [Xanthovirga aplysinae]|uniref:helix-turn-helix domain-containing protein n=1 Tax=Xanthovirga aplysinae TaxID=2529853 RepID=UPI0012BB664D|nr:helix-turn-helix transcriptional regulator [Xanthovirga aplysinae]MTI33021.1 XRE family transcriptional regulator [Xanthovirga aplysinae]